MPVDSTGDEATRGFRVIHWNIAKAEVVQEHSRIIKRVAQIHDREDERYLTIRYICIRYIYCRGQCVRRAVVGRLGGANAGHAKRTGRVDRNQVAVRVKSYVIESGNIM